MLVIVAERPCKHSLLIFKISVAKAFQRALLNATEAIGIVRKEGLSFPVRALVLIIDNLVLIPALEFHFGIF
jgi:hypothetical protein